MAKPPSRSALLARELLARIARRELRPGDPIDLPALGRRHGVSRTVVREALADLGGKGLVTARPKVGTTIAPESQWNLLDPVLVAVAVAEPGPDSMLAEATELRGLIEPALAAGAARDAGRPQRAAVLDAVRALASAVGASDREAYATADLALDAAIAQACTNRLLRSVDRALVPVRALHRERLLARHPGATGLAPAAVRALTLRTALGLAIARRDEGAAAAHALHWVQLSDSAARGAEAAAEPAPAGAVAARAAVAAVPFEHAAATAIPATPAAELEGVATEPAAAGDWLPTRTMVRESDPFAPVRRARLVPDDHGAAPLVVPELLAEGPRGARTARAGLR
jgi:DNA-binding FadR family transcriptional regulator